MKYKQFCPKPVRSIESFQKQHKRCSLCDSLLKTHRYLLKGKSIHEPMIINQQATLTFAQCYQRYVTTVSLPDQFHLICLKCCENLQHLHSLHLNAQELVRKIRRTCSKTKRLNHVRQSYSTEKIKAAIKEEPSSLFELIETNLPSHEPLEHIHSSCECCPPYSYHPTRNNASSIPYTQFMINPPIFPQENDFNNERPLSPEDDRSLSPCINDEESSSKTTRIARRQYDFVVELPDQNSLNTFLERSSSETNSRWTWRRTSANSRGYKIYYVCNFSMRRHYHPCAAAMYALFNPEGSISIFSHGQHQHTPKNRLPLTITDETKDEIFKCLQASMTTSDIRKHLVRLKLPFGDTKKLNNFIKYHKELMRFGAVTNVRVNGSAYRQPQYWAIRRPSPTTSETTR